LTLLDGAITFPLQLGDYQRSLLQGQEPTSAALVKRRDGGYYLQVAVEVPAQEPSNTPQVKGVDLGRRDIATTSEGEAWSGQRLQAVRDRFARTRASLQSRQRTRSVARLLRRLSGRERRYQRAVNHQISRSLVDRARQQNAALALEDLGGIRQRTNRQPRSKPERRRSNSWAFYQLRQFLAYKANIAGVPLVAVPPAHTSQSCHQCGRVHPQSGGSYRHGKRFNCEFCGWHGDADLNGARNIALLGAAVTRPAVQGPACSLASYVAHGQSRQLSR